MTKISKFPQSLWIFTLDDDWFQALKEELWAIKWLEEDIKKRVLAAFWEDSFAKLPDWFLFRRDNLFDTVEIFTVRI